MKCFLVHIFLLLGFHSAFTQSYIDFQQNRIDQLDGIENWQFNGEESASVLFEQVDKLQLLLAQLNLESHTKEKIRLSIYFHLVNFNEHSSLDAREIKSFYILEKYLQQLEDKRTNVFFRSNPILSYTILPFIYATPEALEFVENEAILKPHVVLNNYKTFSSASYAPAILSKLIEKDPIAAKQYFSGLHVLYSHLKSSSNKTDSLVLAIYQHTGSSSNALCLLQAIVNEELTIQEANNIAKLGSEQFFTKLVELASSDSILARNSVDNALKTSAIKKIRLINSLYENHDDKHRFESLAPYSSQQIYHIIVYSEEEIFTSSFNGVFNLLLAKIKQEGKTNYGLLEEVNFNQFRTFLKMCISYGKLEYFLDQMSIEQREELISKFAYLDCEKDALREAVSLADALGSLNDSLSLIRLEENLLQNYKEAGDPNLRLIYTLLMKLFQDKAVHNQEAYQTITSLITLPSINEISRAELLGRDNLHTQIHCFYDDEDGITSFQTFLSLWRNKDWKIKDFGEFIVITSVNSTPIQILANKPQHDFEGQKLMNQFVDAMHADIEVLVHRGHSFYVSRTIRFLREETKVVLLGSCGGYHQVTDILTKSPSAHIISTKQIGTFTVNNPLIYKLAQNVDAGQPIKWDEFWLNLSKKFTKNSYAHDKFAEYVPPHQNLGAAFIQAYRSYLDND